MTEACLLSESVLNGMSPLSNHSSTSTYTEGRFKLHFLNLAKCKGQFINEVQFFSMEGISPMTRHLLSLCLSLPRGRMRVERRRRRVRHWLVRHEPRPHPDVLRPLQDGVHLPRAAADVLLDILVLGAAVEAHHVVVGLDAGEQGRRRRRAVRHLRVHGVGLQRAFRTNAQLLLLPVRARVIFVIRAP